MESAGIMATSCVPQLSVTCVVLVSTAGNRLVACQDSPSHYILSPQEGAASSRKSFELAVANPDWPQCRAVLEVFEAPIPQEGAQTGNQEGLSTGGPLREKLLRSKAASMFQAGVTVAILAGGLFTFVVLALVSAYWAAVSAHRRLRSTA